MLELAVLAEPLAVVAHDEDRGRPPTWLLEGGGQAPELLVHRRDLAQVRVLRGSGCGRAREACTDGADRSSGPRGRAAAGLAFQPRESPLRRLGSCALGAPAGSSSS